VSKQSEGSTSFCEQKEAKKLLLFWATGGFTSTVQIKKSFCALFSKSAAS
jgi:hypothetical protein